MRSHAAEVVAIKQVVELLVGECQRVIIEPVRPRETLPLRALVQQPVAVQMPDQQLDLVTTPPAKDKQLAGERIGINLCLDQGRQTIKAITHVRDTGNQPDSMTGRWINHDNTRKMVVRVCWQTLTLRQALAPLLFDDETLAAERRQRDPVAPTKPSASAKRKKTKRCTDDGLLVHSFTTLIAELGTRCRHRCRLKAYPDTPAFEQDTEPQPLQARALELIQSFPVTGK